MAYNQECSYSYISVQLSDSGYFLGHLTGWVPVISTTVACRYLVVPNHKHQVVQTTHLQQAGCHTYAALFQVWCWCGVDVVS